MINLESELLGVLCRSYDSEYYLLMLLGVWIRSISSILISEKIDRLLPTRTLNQQQ